MNRTIDMRSMRYINLFARICKVSTTNCFNYNNNLIFAVPRPLMTKAIGREGNNIKQIAEVLRKKIKVIAMPNDISGLRKFVEDIVDPVKFSGFELKDKTVTISAGMESKAVLIGRNRMREKELQDILSKTFDVEKLRIS